MTSQTLTARALRGYSSDHCPVLLDGPFGAIITFNVGNASDAKVRADILDLIELEPLAIMLQEVADRRRCLHLVPGYRTIQPDGPVKGHCALLVRHDANPRNVRLHQISPHTDLNAHDAQDIPGGAKGSIPAKFILACDVTDRDGEDRTVAGIHFTPGASHNETASRLLGMQAEGSAAWLADQPLWTDLAGDCNGRPSRPEFAPLRKVADHYSAPSRKGAPIDIHWVKAAAPKPTPKPKEEPVSGWMPGVIRKPIAPGSNDPAIHPVGVVDHIAVSMADSLHDLFENDGGIESHMYVRLDGTIEQYRSIFVQADAQSKGNTFTYDGRACGFVSVETEGMGGGKWTAAQLASIKRIHLFVDAASDYDTLRLAPAWNRPGAGYHRLFAQWNPNNHSCPGDARVRQFRNDLLPALRSPEEDDMQLTDKIHPDDPDSPTVADVLWSQDKLRYRTDARLKQIIGMLDPGPLSDEIASKVNVKAGITADQVKAAVKAALREGVDES